MSAADIQRRSLLKQLTDRDALRQQHKLGITSNGETSQHHPPNEAALSASLQQQAVVSSLLGVEKDLEDFQV